MKSKRFKVKKAYAGLKSKANALRGKKGMEMMSDAEMNAMMEQKQKGKGKKQPKTYKGKSMKPGGGGKFKKGVDAMTAKQGMSKKKAAVIMASAGRKKYGKKQMSAWSAAGRKRAKGK